MAFDERLCKETHRGVNASLNRLWGFFSACALMVVLGFSYSATTANNARTTVEVVSERLEAYHEEQAGRQSRVIKLLEEQQAILKEIRDKK